VQPTTELLLAVSLLRFHQIDAVPIEFKPSQKKHLAVFGYSCLSKLLKTRPKNYQNFLQQPATRAALEISTIDVNAKIFQLLQLFQKTKFGFAWVESKKIGAFASLQDLLSLYEEGTFETDATLANVSSPIFSLSKQTNIRSVIDEMFKRRIRRIFVSGTSSLVTDRMIISHLFSPSRLGLASENPEEFLKVSLGDIEPVEPPKIRGSATAKKGASMMQDRKGECLVCEEGVITPWDLIMKPLTRGALKITG